MTKTEDKSAIAAVIDILLSNPDGLHEVIRAVMQEVLEAFTGPICRAADVRPGAA
ncbi:hypothetical protein [Mesorhizobium australicum]|uniref:hypothetical protein n=1 Tax=Mesorhizobium australicum TaxID=536018 RepID=UPI003336E92E